MINGYLCLLPLFIAAMVDGRMVHQRRALPAGVDLGSCTDPTMQFGIFDNRIETSFQPNNLQEFAHTSAQNPAIISEFICDTFVNKCGANQAAKDLCAKAEAATQGAPKVGATADTFNAVFGFQTNFAAVQALGNDGKPVGAVAQGGAQAGAGQGAAQAGAGQVNAAAPAEAVVTATAVVQGVCSALPVATQAAANGQAAGGQAAIGQAAGGQAAGGQAAGGNNQPFTGALGGIAPPAVLTGGRGFVVGDADFLNVAAAIDRSCAVQHNQCANAANSGAAFKVSDCDAQEKACKAA